MAFAGASSVLDWGLGSGEGAVQAVPAAMGSNGKRRLRLLSGESAVPLQGEGSRAGLATGPLVVSNLTVATSLIGTPWFPSLAGCVLVSQEVGEEPYGIDRS